MEQEVVIARRNLIKSTAMIAAVAPLATFATSTSAQEQTSPVDAPTKLAEVSLGPNTVLTVERRGQVALFGLNRPQVQNRVDPETMRAMAKAYYDYDHDPSLRAAVLFGHGEHFSRGIDVDAYKAVANSGDPLAGLSGVINPLGLGQHLTKPLIVAVHGDTWNLGDELFLAADIRVAAANTDFGQDENTHGRFPGGGSTVRFVREAGWGNAMRYILTGEHWSAQEAYRMGTLQEVAETPQAALDRAVAIANKVAACGPLGIKTSLVSAHLAVDPAEGAAFSKLGVQYRSLYSTHDFVEGLAAQAAGRPPVFHGN